MVKAGLRLVIGSWKIIDMRLPRIRAISRSDSDSRSVPAKLIRLAERSPPRASRFMIASAVTDLPQPDSPTRQWVSPFSTRNEAPRTAARPAAERHLQVLDLEQRAHRNRSAPSRLRRPSPTRLMPSTSTNSATPGIMITQGEKNM